jgi:hypothetical protein
MRTTTWHALALIAALAGCGDGSAPPAPSAPPTTGPAWSLPAGWTQKQNELGMTLIAVAPLDDASDKFTENVNVLVADIPADTSLDEFHAQAFDPSQMGTMLTDFKPGDTSSTMLGDLAAKRLTYTHRMGVARLKVLAYTLVRGNKGYVITCSATHDRFDAYVPTFEWIASTFRP